jgi:hypothetical protein
VTPTLPQLSRVSDALNLTNCTYFPQAMALRNKMRGGGTTIGALDGFNGPSSNSYSPGAQGQGQMGPTNGSVSRQMSLSMSPSGLYSPHIGTNIGVMQSHIPGELDPVTSTGVS